MCVLLQWRRRGRGRTGLAAGNVGRQLLDGDRFARVQQIVHFPDGVTAVVVQCLLRCLYLLVLPVIRWQTRAVARIRRRLVIILALRRPPGVVGAILFELVQDADWTILTNTVTDLQRVDPHGQLRRERVVNHLRVEAAHRASLSNHGVHSPVDADAAVARALERLLREPVVTVASPEDLHQTALEFGELFITDTRPRGQPHQVDQEIAGRL